MSYYFEPPSVALAAPPAVAGDLIVGRADGNFDRLAIGAAGQILSVVGGAVVWGEGPLTTAGDLLIGATGAAPTRLAIGTDGQMLSLVAGSVTWGEGPLTTIGDLLIGSTAGSAPTRLGIGANGALLNVSGGAIRWGNTIDTGGLTITAGSLIVTAGTLSVGATPATAGAIRIPNNALGLQARNAANSANVPLIDLDASNVIQIAASGQAVTISGNITAPVTFFAIGATPAASGTFRLTNNAGGMRVRNAANSADIWVIDADASNIIQIAATGHAVTISGNTTFAGFVVVAATLAVGTTPAATGAVRLPNATGNGANFRNAAGTADIIGMELDNADHLRVGAEVVGLGAGAVCILSNAGAPGPTGNGQAAWVKVVARNGTLYWVPVWT